jgi:hypothetical protein
VIPERRCAVDDGCDQQTPDPVPPRGLRHIEMTDAACFRIKAVRIDVTPADADKGLTVKGTDQNFSRFRKPVHAV